MKKIFKYEINESVAAKAAMNCVHKRLFKEFYMGSPTPQEQVMNGDYDLDEWENDAYGNAAKRELVIQALIDAKLIRSKEEGLPLNNKIQQLLNKTNFSVSNEQDAMKFVKAYGQQIIGKTQEQEELTVEQEETDYTNDGIPSYKFSYQESFLVWSMRHILPYLKEIKEFSQIDDTTLKHAIMKILKREGRFSAPETERDCQSWVKDNSWQVKEELGINSEEEELPQMEQNDIKQTLTQIAASELYYEDGDLDSLYQIISDILSQSHDMPMDEDDCYDWVDEHKDEIEEQLYSNPPQEQEEGYPELWADDAQKKSNLDPRKFKNNSRKRIVNALVKQLQSYGISMTDKEDILKAQAAINDILDRTNDYPDLKSRVQMVNWCSDHHQEVARRIYR